MAISLITIFVLAYAAIAFEHVIKINKSASALIGAGLLWTIYAIALGNPILLNEQLSASLVSTAQIVFFLMGAMTIVEVVDGHNGFEVITSKIKTKKMSDLLFLIGGASFILSSILDNLTTSIIMVSLLPKILIRREDRLLLSALIIIAANAGGAWSPIGDVTTTMLWINGHITSLEMIKWLFLPSVVSVLVPVLIASVGLRGQIVLAPETGEATKHHYKYEGGVMFFLGLGILITVPIFKSATQLPPFMGILFGLGLLWLIGDLFYHYKNDREQQPLTLIDALSRIDLSSIVFFIGILLAVAVLEHSTLLTHFAHFLADKLERVDVIVFMTGLASAVVDNVPLVAASMGMYSLSHYPPNDLLWIFLAYCAGTGGSLLVIGSAAGIAAMGLEQIDFFWYMKKISWLALIGYIAGAATFLLERYLFQSYF